MMRRALLLLFFVLVVSAKAGAQTWILRIADYNIEADIGVTNEQATFFTNIVISAAEGPPLPGLIAPATNGAAVQLGGVLEGIGEELVKSNAQPVDIVALEETTSNLKTVTPIVNGLNTFYGIAGMYTNSPYQGTQSGSTGVGNGPNAIVYNTHTVQLLASTPVDPPGGTSQLGGVSSGKSGEYREVMRYQFAHANVQANSDNSFYIYVSHYKSGANTTANNTNSRAGEAWIVRSNMMTTLPPTARILHVGDFNTGDASEMMYITLTTPGPNQLADPINPANNWTIDFDTTTWKTNLTDSATYLQYRDDYQMMTTNVFYGSGAGLALAAGTYHSFGNNGTAAYHVSVNSGGNTVFNNRLVTNGPVFISGAQLLVDLTGASDHLPIVADYTIPMPAPKITSALFSTSTSNLTLSVTNGITNAVYFVLMNTNLNSSLTNWTAVASNTAAAGNFSFTATNVFSPGTSQRFFILKTR